MTFFAICFFCIVVVFEMYIVLWLPIQLQRTTVLVENITRQRVLQYFDDLRTSHNYLERQNSKMQYQEIELAGRVLDIYAMYLRDQGDFMSMGQLLEMEKILYQYQLIMIRWVQKQFYFHKAPFQLPDAMTVIEKKNGL